MGKSGISRILLISVSLLIIIDLYRFFKCFVSRETLHDYHRPESTSNTLMSLEILPVFCLLGQLFPDLSLPAFGGLR